MSAGAEPMIITCKALEPFFAQQLCGAMPMESFDISLHVRPNNLRQTLQEAIDRVDGKHDPIYLGYGLCSQSIVGLVARRSRLVVFRTDDCIGIFLGDRQKQKEHSLAHPGSYYLCRGWIGDGAGSVFDENERMIARYGQERAAKLMKKMLGHYSRLVHIIMPGSASLGADREYAREKARLFDLEYVEIEGTESLIQDMLAGQFGQNIMSFEPGQRIELENILGAGGAA